MILPLGFGKKNPQRPWVTLFFALVLIFLGGPLAFRISEIEDKLEKSKYLEFSEKSRLRLILNECPNFPLSPAECEFLSKATDKVKSATGKIKLRRELSAMDEYKKLTAEQKEKVSDYLRVMLEPEKALPEASFGTELFKNYWDYKNYFRIEAQKEFSKFNVAQKNKINPWNLLISQIAHAGVLHLAGNLLIIMFFGFLLEQRVHWTVYLLIFLLGGFAGIAGQVLLNDNPYQTVFGASAGATSLVGAVVALFWSRNIRYAVIPYSFFIKRQIRARVWWSVPFLFMLTDLVMYLASEQTQVAFKAHLIGFAVGFSIGGCYRWLRPLPLGFIFTKEYSLFKKLKELKDPAEKESAIRKILIWNPDNFIAMEEGFQLPAPQAHEFYKDFGSDCLALHHRERYQLKAHKAVSMVPPQENINELFHRSGKDTLQWLGDVTLDIGDWLNAIRVYACYLEKYETASNSNKVYETVKGLIEHGLKEPEQHNNLLFWYRSLKNQDLITALSNDFPQLIELKETS